MLDSLAEQLRKKIKTSLNNVSEEEAEVEPALDESVIQQGEETLSGDEDAEAIEGDGKRLLHGGPMDEDVEYYPPWYQPREEVFDKPLEEATESLDLQPLLEDLVDSLLTEEPSEDDPWNTMGGESKSNK